MISKEEVQKVAKLARLELTEQEIEKMQKDLSSILDYFDLLKKVKGKPEKGELKKKNNLRKDEYSDENNNSAGRLIQAAPDNKDGYIKVKQIL